MKQAPEALIRVFFIQTKNKKQQQQKNKTQYSNFVNFISTRKY